MTRPSWRLLVPTAVVVALALFAAWWVYGRTRPVTAEDLQGEWVQDPDFLQHAGEDLDSQKQEVDQWENYQFAFHGTHLIGWRLTFDDHQRDGTGWAQGKGVSFDGDFSLVPGKGATVWKFSDHAKAPQEARLTWEGEQLSVALGERKFRLKKGTADQLRVRKLIAAP